MAEKGAYIGDLQSLERLNLEIERTGREMANIDNNVGSYIGRVKDVLDRQLDFLRDKLEEAEARLSAAESSLSFCQASQVFIPEMGGYMPTCMSEEMEVASAREEVAECRNKYAEGQHIVGECQREICDYNSPSGGHGLIEKMVNSQMPDAIHKLSECISKAQDILAANVQNVQSHQYGFESVKPNNQSVSNPQDERLEAFRNNIHGSYK